MRLLAVGNFYPQVTRSATFLTGLTYCLSRIPAIEHVTVLCPEGSALPDSIDPVRVSLRTCWSNSSPLSIVKLGLEAMWESRHHDILFFNIYPTSFGTRPITNGLGLLLPSLTSVLGAVPVVTYMHNFLETQAPEGLGYRPGRLVQWTVRTLEALILHLSVVFVPLQIQAAKVRAAFGVEPERWFLPFLDAVYLRPTAGPQLDRPTDHHAARPLRLLLFGAFGPQKDFKMALRVLSELRSAGQPVHLTLAGTINPGFPSVRAELTSAVEGVPPSGVRLLLDVPDSRLPELFMECDVLVLPYRQAGGYSGAMNLGAYYGLKLVSTDLPELRECAKELGADCLFYRREDPDSLKQVLLKLMGGPAFASGETVRSSPRDGRAALIEVARMVDRLSALTHGVQRPQPTLGPDSAG